MRNLIYRVVCLAALLGLGLAPAAWAQVNPPIAKNVPTPEQQAPSVWGGRFEIFGAGSMQFALATTANGKAVATTNVAGVQLGLRVHGNDKNAFEFRVAAAQPRQTYGSNLGVTSRNLTYSFDYVFTVPSDGRFRPFILAGGDYITYSPTGGNNTPGAGKQHHAGIDYGAGIDWKLGPQLSIRVEYRELWYRIPDFNLINISKWNRMPIPDIGLAWHF